MALGKLKNRSRKFKPPALMLTSMMDMFTIILIFLLFSFSENPETLTLDHNLELPKSSCEMEYAKAIKVILSKKELSLNDEVLATVKGATILGLTDVQDPKDSNFFKRLESKKIKAQNSTGSDNSEHLLLLCDKSHSFKTINTVIKTAGMAGYPNFQFAVLQE